MAQSLLPPPLKGWNTRDPLTALDAGFSPLLDNFVAGRGGVHVRKGWRVWATGLPGRVDGLFDYAPAASGRKLFASSGTGIYEVTAAGAVGAAVVGALTNSRVSGITVPASGGTFLLTFNGTNTPQTYSGTAWAAWTATGVPLPAAWACTFKGRLFVGHPERLSFWYGTAGAIAGAFTEFPLQGVATGGGVVAMATLSGDGGSGPDDLAIFVTSEGEVIVYEGTDPSDVSTWGLVGRWRTGLPVGAPHRCVLELGGDVLLMTDAGVLPLSSLRSGSDFPQAMQKYGVTRRIDPTWREYVAQYGAETLGWGMANIPHLNLTLFNVPVSGTAAWQVAVTGEGALSRFAGVPAACWLASGGRAYCGDAAAGRVLLYGEDWADNGLGIRAEGLTHFDMLKAPSRVKVFNLTAPIIRGTMGHSADVVLDWRVPNPVIDMLGPSAAPPSLPASTGGAKWGTAVWGQSKWSDDARNVTRHWTSSPGVGQSGAARLRAVGGLGDAAWLGSHVAYEVGGPVR